MKNDLNTFKMKKTIVTLIGILCASLMFANNGQFEKAMAKNVPAMFQASDAGSLQSSINNLVRIGDAEGDRWEPYYYAAFGYIKMIAFVESGEEKDGYLDQALAIIEKGEAVKPSDSELEALRGYVHMMRVNVDPATRGMQYSGMAIGSFNKAIALDKNNARAHFLLGRMQFGMAQFMGGGNEDACKSFATAKEIFDSTEKDARSFAPSWGAESNEEIIAQACK